jgi:hypothetical protein
VHRQTCALLWNALKLKLDRRLIDLPPAKSKNKRRKLVEIPEDLAARLTTRAKTEGSVMPCAKVQVAMENAVEKAGIEWPHNCLRHSFCSHAVALHGFTWTSLQAEHSERMLEISSESRHQIQRRRLLRRPPLKRLQSNPDQRRLPSQQSVQRF